MQFVSPSPFSRFNQYFVLVVVISLFVTGCGEGDFNSRKSTRKDSTQNEVVRIISLHGAITETLYDLGLGGKLVGVDVTSTYPDQFLADVPKVGHVSQLNVEGLLSLKPDVVIVESGKPELESTLSKIEGANVIVLRLPLGTHLSNAVSLTESLLMQAEQKGLNLEVEQGEVESFRENIIRDSIELSKYLTVQTHSPKTLFLYARGAGRIMAGGRGTSADAMLAYAGAINAADVDQFANLTPESVVAANPEVILMFESGLASLDEAGGLKSVPGLSATRALQEGKIVTMDGHYLLGFGPRAAQAALDLAKQLRGDVSRLEPSLSFSN